MTAELPTDLPIRIFPDAVAWESWLVVHSDAKALRLKIVKKGSGTASITSVEAIDVALCHGWIDGQKKPCDERGFLQRFTPRRMRSLWSKINVAKVEALIASGRMAAAGQLEIHAAKADGRWHAAYDAPSGMVVPDELATAPAKHDKARRFFDQLDKTHHYAFCWPVRTAKKAETKAARAEKFVGMLARGEKLHEK